MPTLRHQRDALSLFPRRGVRRSLVRREQQHLPGLHGPGLLPQPGSRRGSNFADSPHSFGQLPQHQSPRFRLPLSMSRILALVRLENRSSSHGSFSRPVSSFLDLLLELLLSTPTALCGPDCTINISSFAFHQLHQLQPLRPDQFLPLVSPPVSGRSRRSTSGSLHSFPPRTRDPPLQNCS